MAQRDRKIMVRVSAAEMDSLALEAKKRGLPLSTYVRDRLSLTTNPGRSYYAQQRERIAKKLRDEDE